MMLELAASTGDSAAASDWVTISAAIGASIVVLHFIIRAFALGFIPEGRRPTSGMAWVLFVMALPLLGLFLWTMLGWTSIGKERMRRQLESLDSIRKNVAKHPITELPGDLPLYIQTSMTLNQNLGALPPVEAGDVQLYQDYYESIQAMADEIDKAQSWVHVEFYIMAWDDVTEPFFAALARAANRGVTVRLLFDQYATRGNPAYKELIRKLQETQIDWHGMLPLLPLRENLRRPDLRNHRKILIVDGEVAFMGSQNMIERGYNKKKNHKVGREWVELTCRVTGSSAKALDAVFSTDWFTETGEKATQAVDNAPTTSNLPRTGEVLGQVVPSGPGIVEENNLRLFTSLIYGAKRRVSITSPYFVPDESLLYAVATAAQRGVEVELFVSEKGDQFMVEHAQASYYKELLKAGVKIQLYRAPYVLHSKHFSVDDDVIVIGSSNMDLRSFHLNYEVSMMMTGGDIVQKMHAVEDAYRLECKILTEEEWSGRPWHRKYVDNAMRLTASLQ